MGAVRHTKHPDAIYATHYKACFVSHLTTVDGVREGERDRDRDRVGERDRDGDGDRATNKRRRDRDRDRNIDREVEERGDKWRKMSGLVKAWVCVSEARSRRRAV
jgi:hypothetical protein